MEPKKRGTKTPKKIKTVPSEKGTISNNVSNNTSNNTSNNNKHKPFTHVILLSIILGIVGVCYSNALEGGFVIDDSEAVVRNRDLRPDAGFAQMWKDDFWGNLIWGNISHKSYRPMCVLTYKLDRIFGEWYYGLNSTDIALQQHQFTKDDSAKYVESALGETPQCLAPLYHKINVIYYAVSCVAAYFLTLHITEGDVLVTFIATSLFAAHPIHTEAVTSIVGRAEVLCMLFAIAGYFAYVRAARPRRGTQWFWLLVSMGCVFLATVSKETGLTYAGLYLAYDILYVTDAREEKRPKNLREATTGSLNRCRHVNGLLGRMVAVIATVGGITYFRYWINGCFKNPANRFVENPIMFSTGLKKWLSLPLNHAKYLQLLVYPHTMSSDYSFDCIPLIESFSDPRNAYGVIAYTSLAIALALAVYTWSRTALMALAALVCTAIPLTNIVVAVGTMIGERLLFSPSLGFCLLVGCVLAWLARRFGNVLWKVFVGALALAATVGYGWRTYVRNPDWNSGDSIFHSAYKVCPRSVKILFVLGSGALKGGNYEAGMEYFRQAEEIAKPNHLCEIDFELGKAYIAQGKVDLGVDFLIKGLQCKYTKGYAFDYIRKLTTFMADRNPENTYAQEIWARALLTVNLTAEASNQYLSMAQKAWTAKNSVVSAVEDAEKYAKKAAAVNPTSCKAQEWAGKILTEQGRYMEAIPYLKAASYKHNCTENTDSTLWYLVKVYDILLPENPRFKQDFYAAVNRMSEKERKKLFGNN